MSGGGRLGLYAAGLVVAFAGAYGVAAVAVPDDVVAAWVGNASDARSAAGHDGGDKSAVAVALPGVSLSAYGYALSPVVAPTSVGEAGELSFKITDAQGEPLTAYVNSHEKDLHLIVVRTDGSEYRHVHPTLNEHTGLWSTPWEWAEAGSYRVYADFVPAVEDGPDKVTLTRTIDVAGEIDLAPVTESNTDHVDGYEVMVVGSLTAGSTSELTLSVSRDGEPVTTLEPYLGAFGHLVALRDGDLAYLHVHAEGDEPKAGDTAGPDITFAAEAPTAGRYLLYLDFQVDGRIHTAEFALDATNHGRDEPTEEHSETGSDGH
ncbi:MAG: heavy-metal-associated domain-containing protein [Homoserinimonas sp.]